MIFAQLHMLQRLTKSGPICVLVTTAVLLVWPQFGMTEPRPARGVFLVADREMLDPNFSETVVLVLDHDPSGTMGLIINRRTEVMPTEVLPSFDGLDSMSEPLFVGGPVNRFGVLMLIRAPDNPAEAETIFDDTYLSGSVDLLHRLINEAPADHQLRLYAGYSGWGPGQLEREINRGDWHLVNGDSALIFSDEPNAVWNQLAPAATIIASLR